jgi:TonB family protein
LGGTATAAAPKIGSPIVSLNHITELPSDAAPPKYPATAIANSTSGKVTLDLTVDPNGKVISSVVVGSSGSIELDQAAMNSAFKWTFPANAAGALNNTVQDSEVIFTISSQ